MNLPKIFVEDLIETLHELAHLSAAETFPNIALEDTVEWDAADFIQKAALLLSEIAADEGPFAEKAKKVLSRA